MKAIWKYIVFAFQTSKLVLALTVSPTSVTITVNLGDFTSVQVTVNPTAGVTGRWTRIDLSGNEVQIVFDGAQYMEAGLGILVIGSFQLSDAGLYVFEASDGTEAAENDPISVYAAGSPSVTTSMSMETASLGQAFVLDCAVFSAETIIDIKWLHINTHGSNTYIDENNTAKYSGSIPSDPSLTIIGVDVNDVGEFWCYAENDKGKTGISTQITLSLAAAATNMETTGSFSTTNNIGTNTESTPVRTDTESTSPATSTDSSLSTTTTNNGNGILTTVTSETTVTSNVFVSTGTSVITTTSNNNLANTEDRSCLCDCEFQAKLGYWASQNLTSYTMEELRIILRPVLTKLENDLRVNKSNLSATRRKLTSAKDNRQAAKQIGSFGVACLILTIGAIVASDIISIKKHIFNIKQIGDIRKS